MTREEEETRPITLPPRPRCVKPPESLCNFKDEEGFCTKRVTTCPHRVKQTHPSSGRPNQKV